MLGCRADRLPAQVQFEDRPMPDEDFLNGPQFERRGRVELVARSNSLAN
jgi:hypothetical protein